jgi:hypothetical protein
VLHLSALGKSAGRLWKRLMQENTVKAQHGFANKSRVQGE